MSKNFVRPLVIGVVFIFSLSAAASERKIKQSEAPKAVIEAVKKKYPSSRMLEFAEEQDNGKTVYEVKVQDGKSEVDVGLSAEGKIVSEEKRLDPSALPAKVSEAISASKYARWKIERAETVVLNENESGPTYEIAVVQGKNRVELMFDPAGKLLKENKKAAAD